MQLPLLDSSPPPPSLSPLSHRSPPADVPPPPSFWRLMCRSRSTEDWQAGNPTELHLHYIGTNIYCTIIIMLLMHFAALCMGFKLHRNEWPDTAQGQRTASASTRCLKKSFPEKVSLSARFFSETFYACSIGFSPAERWISMHLWYPGRQNPRLEIRAPPPSHPLDKTKGLMDPTLWNERLG
jgi:hypothetical protein